VDHSSHATTSLFVRSHLECLTEATCLERYELQRRLYARFVHNMIIFPNLALQTGTRSGAQVQTDAEGQFDMYS